MGIGVKWCTPVTPAPPRQEDAWVFEAGLDYITSSRPARAGKTLTNKQTKITHETNKEGKIKKE